jgi:hypothetical protein
MKVWCLLKNKRVVAKIPVSCYFPEGKPPSSFDFNFPLFICSEIVYKIELRDATDLD